MRPSPVRIALLAAALTALPGVAAAQFPPPPPPPGSPAPAAPSAIDQRWPQPQQQTQQPPQPQQPASAQPPAAPQPAPAATPRAPAAKQPAAKPPAARPQAAKPPVVHAKPAPSAPGLAVTCGGVFAKDTNHLKLAVKYDSRNIAYTDVEGPGRTKIKATVLFPRDPKRRLEVLWSNEAARSDIQVISINGQSHWVAPRGLKLGLSLAALEKLNRRPFKLTGFGAELSASVLDWQGGALASLPGGCKVGVRLTVDRTTPAIAGDQELLSNAAALKSVKANVAEILLGY